MTVSVIRDVIFNCVCVFFFNQAGSESDEFDSDEIEGIAKYYKIDSLPQQV